MKIEVLNALKIVITTFICSAIIMPFMIKIAKHVGALDVPRSDEGNRSIFEFFTWIYDFWDPKY